jgi:phage tail-like protein
MRPDEIARLLPEIYQRAAEPGSVLNAVLAVMATLHGSVEAAVEEPERYVDPRRAPERLVPELASWVGLARYLDRTAERSGGGRTRVGPDPAALRELAALAAGLGRRRGTADALRGFLVAATGVPGFDVTDETGTPFHLRVTVPPEAQVQRALVERIVAGEKPAFSTAEIVLAAQTPPIKET